MQKTNMGINPLNNLAVQFQNQTQHAVGGGVLRPDVVWFGEMLPERALMDAQEAAESCDVFITAGTSSQVYPAAGFVSVAASHGAYTAEINAERTPVSGRVNCSILGRTGEILPRVVSGITDLLGR
jgi:NAD-dependent deacetylase